MIGTTLAPGVAWPYSTTPIKRPTKPRYKSHTSGVKPTIAPRIVQHLERVGSSSATFMIAAGVTPNLSALHRTLREMISDGVVVQVKNDNAHAHQNAKYFALRGSNERKS